MCVRKAHLVREQGRMWQRKVLAVQWCVTQIPPKAESLVPPAAGVGWQMAYCGPLPESLLCAS